MTNGTAEVALATIVVAIAASLAGASGYGFSLMAAPLLLLAGLDAGPVVFSCLLLTAVTRLAVAIRFRASVERSSAVFLIAGSLPGLFVGSRFVAAGSANLLRAAIGFTVMAVAVAFFAVRSRPRDAPGRWRCLAAGFGGGLLGALAGLNGVGPAFGANSLEAVAQAAVCHPRRLRLRLRRDRASGRARDDAHPLWAAGYAIAWAPVALASNAVGVAAGLRLSPARIRPLALLVSFAAGAGAAATALR